MNNTHGTMENTNTGVTLLQLAYQSLANQVSADIRPPKVDLEKSNSPSVEQLRRHSSKMTGTCSEASSVSPSDSIDNSLRSSSSSNSCQIPEDTNLKHSDRTLKKMESYLDQSLFVDVTLIAGDKRVPAHKLVLSASSDYFAAMFTSDVREATQSEIVLQAVDPDALAACIQYCYTGRVELQEETVEVLLSTACLLQLSEVVNECSSFLIKQLDPSNCLGIYLFADRQGCTELLQVSVQYITQYFLDVIHNQEFLLLPVEEVCNLLKRDDLNIPCEEAIFYTILKWLEYDADCRKQHAAQLLGLVRLPLLPPQFIPDHIESNEIFKDDKSCQELIMEAMRYHLLPERRSTLQTLRTNPRKSVVGLMYAVGGMDSIKGPSTIEVYDCRTNEWSRETNMTGRRLQFGVAVMKNKLYVVGGRDGLKTLNTVECYDTITKQWTTIPSMNTHRHGLGVAVLEGPMYAVGGHDGWSYLNSAERWDPLAKQWSYIASMSTQRSTVGVTVLNNRLYAVGGRDGSSCLRTAEWFDPHTNRWTMCAPMCQRRGWVGVGALNGYLYAVGGHDAPQTSHSNLCASRYDSVERYDPKTDSWTMISSLSLGRDAVGVCLLGNQLYAVGGYDGNTCLNLVEAYDEQSNEWNQIAKLNIGRAGACVVVVKNSSDRYIP